MFGCRLSESVLTTESWQLRPVGGLAQLGERLLCKQEVIGSIPIVSRPLFWRVVLDEARPGFGLMRLCVPGIGLVYHGEVLPLVAVFCSS